MQSVARSVDPLLAQHNIRAILVSNETARIQQPNYSAFSELVSGLNTPLKSQAPVFV